MADLDFDVQEELLEQDCGVDVKQFPPPVYSKKLVSKAGRAVIEGMPWDPDKKDELIRLFRIPHDWRISHGYPMRIITNELRSTLKRAKCQGVVAARLKRMTSIEAKLRKKMDLATIQDIGGCRAVLNSMDDLNRIIAAYREYSGRHILKKDQSYIEKPKSGGYRSHHFVFEYSGKTEDQKKFNSRKIEIQLRSQLQHSWATAVEAIGLSQGENLKGGIGNPDWLKLFELMSSELAEIEGCPVVPGAPEKRERNRQLRALNKKIGAVARLESLNQAFEIIERRGAALTPSPYYIVQFDYVRRRVSVIGYDTPELIYSQYRQEEVYHEDLTTVLVEVNKIETLRDAYPNYFLDVKLFTEKLKATVLGNNFSDSMSAPSSFDLSWFDKWWKLKKSN